MNLVIEQQGGGILYHALVNIVTLMFTGVMRHHLLHLVIEQQGGGIFYHELVNLVTSGVSLLNDVMRAHGCF